MGSPDPPEIPTELRFLSDCLVAISNQEYRSALETAKAGLENLLGSEASINTQQLASVFYMTIGSLESKLKEAYGERWDEGVEIPALLEKEKEIRCSFCGKDQAEVKKIIAGPNVFICDECVGICNQILESSSSPDLNGGRA
jgi:hypothetical protein